MGLPNDKTDSPRIRTVEASHISDLISLGEETNLSHWSAQSYLEEMKNADAIILRLVTGDNSTIGFVVGRLVTGGAIERQTDAEIYNIAVTSDFQRQGHGQQLFDSFVAACREKQAKTIWLEVRESNQRAICFYEKNGFERVQTRPSFYENPREHALLMRLVLE